MNQTQAARALIVDDDDFLRVLLARTLRDFGFDEVLDCDNAADGMRTARQVPLNLAVLDLDLGAGPNGIDLAHGLRKAQPKIAIAVLSTYRDPRLLGANRELPTGAIYLSKRDVQDLDLLEEQLRTLLDWPRDARPAPPETRIDGRKLSDNQIAVMRLVAEGYSNAEIAKRRHLTPPAVEKAISRLVKQLGIDPGEGDNVRILITQEFMRLSGSSEVRRS